MEQRAVKLHIFPFETRIFRFSLLSRCEKTYISLNCSIITRRLVCLITGFTLHLDLEFSSHRTNILLRFLNQLRRQIRSTPSGISIFLSLSKRRKLLCLQFIRGPTNFDKVIIYYFFYIWNSIWRSHCFNHFIRTADENLWPSILFCTPWHIQHKNRYLCNFHYLQILFLLPQIPPGTLWIALFQFRELSYSIKTVYVLNIC
jgi:hypothetical protein